MNPTILPVEITVTNGEPVPDWREEARRKAKLAADAREPGYYWIKRNEPDGEKGWEPAEFVKWLKPPVQIGWFIIGTNGKMRTEVHPPFSNAWEFGPRIIGPA